MLKNSKYIAQDTKTPLRLCIIILFILFLICALSSFIEPIVGKYVSSIVVDSQSAQVGKWSVSANTKAGTDNEVLLSTTQKNDSYVFIVSNINASGNINEVETKYTVAVDFGDADLPSNVTMTLSYTEGEAKTLTFKKLEDSNVYVLENEAPNEWKFNPGSEQNRELSLDFTLTSLYNNQGEIGAKIDNIKVRVYFEQTQE